MRGTIANGTRDAAERRGYERLASIGPVHTKEPSFAVYVGPDGSFDYTPVYNKNIATKSGGERYERP